MSNYDVLIYAKPAEWAALVNEEAPSFNHAYDNAQTGYWKPFGEYEVYNVMGTREQVQAILAALTDVARVYAWGQGTGLDDLDTWPTDPTDLLAVMKDHVTYDEQDTPVYTPATLANPNWRHVFQGQQWTDRVFAGEFNSDFNGDFF